MKPETRIKPSSRRILLADDSQETQLSAGKLAAEFDYEVFQARRGADVLALASSIAPHLIVLDVQFPDADGRDILAQLKADPRTAHIPVVVWSGRDTESDRKIALRLGAEDYVEKTDAQRLFDKIRRVMLRLERP